MMCIPCQFDDDFKDKLREDSEFCDTVPGSMVWSVVISNARNFTIKSLDLICINQYTVYDES